MIETSNINVIGTWSELACLTSLMDKVKYKYNMQVTSLYFIEKSDKLQSDYMELNSIYYTPIR